MVARGREGEQPREGAAGRGEGAVARGRGRRGRGGGATGSLEPLSVRKYIFSRFFPLHANNLARAWAHDFPCMSLAVIGGLILT